MEKIEAIQDEHLLIDRIDERLNALVLQINDYENKIEAIKQMDATEELKQELMNVIFEEKSNVEYEYVDLRFSKIIDYDYSKNIKILKKRLSQIKTPLESLEGVDYKSIFEKVIAVDRNNLILCIHLSSTYIDKIDLESATNNPSILSGSFNYHQTRLCYEIKWRIIII